MVERSPSGAGPPLGSTAMVGRAPEQEVLLARLRAALAGQGSVVLIGGDAGIGKTTLVDWLAAEARREGAQVLGGHCYDLTLTPPYGPWLDALAGIDPADHPSGTPRPFQPGADLAAIGGQALLFDQVYTMLAQVAAARPVVLVLEDLHWADPASLELLRHVARETSPIALLLVATYRTEELGRRHPLARLLPHVVREARAERIDLRGLGDDDVRAYVRGRYRLAPADESRLVSYLRARAEGNPFYLVEVLRTLASERLLQGTGDGWVVGDLDRVPVPPLVQQVIEGRLARLDGEDQRLLALAAVIGQVVPLDLWQAAGGCDGARLTLTMERAIDAHLIQETPGAASVAFTHALVRETLYYGQVLPRRQMLHRQVAEILTARPDPPASTVATHFARADDPRAIDWLIRAGELALSVYAARDAVADLTRAQELATRAGQDLPLAAYRTRAAAQAMLGEFDRARHDYETVLERSRATGDQRSEWQALLDVGLLWSERDYERTGAYYRAALDLARAVGDKPMVAYSLNRVANWHVNLDEADMALPLHREALAIFEECGDRRGIADTLDLLGLASGLNCDFVSSQAYYERVIPLLRDLDDRHRLASALAGIALNGGSLDCDIAAPVYREAAFWIRGCEEGLAIAREIGWAAGESFNLTVLCMATGVRGDLGRALRDGEAALAIAERIGHREWTVFARHTLGRLWVELLDPRRAEGELEQALALARLSGSRFWTVTVAATLASVRIATGDLGQAAALLGGVVRTDRPPSLMGQRQCWFAQAELFLAQGDPEGALAIADRLIETRPNPTADHGIPQLSKLRGDAFTRLRRFDEAEQAYRAARDGAALFGFRPLLWRVDAARGELYRAAGRPMDAEVAVRSALATVEALADTISDEALRVRFLAEAAARVSPERPGAPHPAAAFGLSPRELEVLGHLAEGKSDREIAAALSISPRTVMRHVTAILNKLGVSSRTAAATLAIRQRIV